MPSDRKKGQKCPSTRSDDDEITNIMSDVKSDFLSNDISKFMSDVMSIVISVLMSDVVSNIVYDSVNLSVKAVKLTYTVIMLTNQIFLSLTLFLLNILLQVLC